MWYRPSIPAFLALPVESLVRSAAGTTRSHKNKCPCVRSTSRGGEPCPSTGESDSSPFGELGETPTVDTVRGGLPLSFASPKETATIAAIRCVALFFPCFVPGILGVTWDPWRHKVHFPGLSSLPKQCAGAQIVKVGGTTLWDVSTRRLYEDPGRPSNQFKLDQEM